MSNRECSVCGKPATCFGSYEGQGNYGYGCDECCGHGNEDGHCDQLSERDRDEWPELLAFDSGVTILRNQLAIKDTELTEAQELLCKVDDAGFHIATDVQGIIAREVHAYTVSHLATVNKEQSRCDVILLADSTDESVSVRNLLNSRHVKYAEVGEIRGPSPSYKRPTLLVRGEVFQGLQEIKKAINTNQHL